MANLLHIQKVRLQIFLWRLAVISDVLSVPADMLETMYFCISLSFAVSGEFSNMASIVFPYY
jgi:hypothetical protein